MFSALLFISPAFSTTLPNGYTELEYIESNGTQCIDTGYKWTTDVTEVGVEYYYLVASGDIVLFGSESLNTSVTWNAFYGSVLYNGGDYMIGTTPFAVRTNPNVNTWESYNAKTTSSTSGIITYNGLETAFAYSGAPYAYGVSKEYSMALFCAHKQGSYQQFSKARVRKFYMKDNGILVRDMVPARNSDAVVGLYDTVNDRFYTNAGTGTFTAGPAVSSCGYTELEYLELQGEAYFNTNVYLSKDMDIEFEFMPVQLTSSGVLSMARSYPYGGFQVSYNINNVINSNTYNDVLVDYFGLPPSGSIPSTNRWIIQRVGSSDNGYILEENKKYKVTIINKVGTFYKDGVVLDTHTYPADGISPNVDPLYINARSDIGNVVYENGDLHVRFYHFLATGVADIVPVKRDCDNVLGLYNKTTGEFLEKLGSGTLVAGPEIAAPATITIHWGDLSEPDATGMCVYGGTFTAPSVTPTAAAGYKFLGWRPI